MIWESSYWKDSLLKSARKLRRMSRRKSPAEKILVDFEREVFISFYTVRKLIEAKKLSGRIAELKINANSYPVKGKDVTLLNWHRVDELYNFESAIQVELDVKFVCNQIIHSYVFVSVFDEQGRLAAILFSSDRKRNFCIYKIELPRIIEFLIAVGSDYPSSSNF
ncbi:hypothetical protein JXM67_13120 [candidate division WOR-3 bacterium]|nr:hypothetical protein [candidate division WOR-3 bacterium]